MQEVLCIVCFNVVPVWYRSNAEVIVLSLAYSLFQLGFIYALSSVILFSCLAWTMSYCIKTLSERVKFFHRHYGTTKKRSKSKTNSNTRQDSRVILALLDRWKRQYLSIYCLIEEINDMFGPILLIFITSTFVRLINNTFRLMAPLAVRGSSWIDNMFLFSETVQDVFFLVLISYVSHRLQTEVHNIYLFDYR